MRIFNFFLALLFLLFAFLQVDAPQPFVSILIYGSMSVVSVMAIFEYYIVRLMLAQAISFVVYGIALLPSVKKWYTQDEISAKLNEGLHPEYITETYQFFGVVVCLSVLVFYYFRSQKKVA